MAEHPAGHESPNVSTGRVLGVLGILGLFVVIVIAVLHLVLRHAVMPDRAQVVARAGVIPPAPRLQPHPAIDIAAERAEKDGMLSQYAWADRSHRYARIPIQRAMQMYVQQQASGHNSGTADSKAAPGADR